MSERWKPEYDETYWVVDTKCNPAVMPVKWVGCQYGHNQYCNGNYFKTRDEALAAAEKVRVLLVSLHDPVTECNQLPKLTAEVFNREDCPEWAQYAAVDLDGEAYYFYRKPYINHAKNKWLSKGLPINWRSLGHGWNATDWQNSLIERPAKDLPKWDTKWAAAEKGLYITVDGDFDASGR